MSATLAASSPTYLVSIGLSLPVTASFALPFTAYYLRLQYAVIVQRIKTQQSLAQQSGSSSSAAKSTDPLKEQEPDMLLAACRAQGNFVENVPLALLFAALAEANGGRKQAIGAALAALLTFRVLHADFGLMSSKGDYKGSGRVAGFFGTASVMVGLAGYAGWMARGYWGL